MLSLPSIHLKKGEDRRIRAGHPWVFSNEIDTAKSPLKNISRGEEVLIIAYDQTPLGIAYCNPHSLIAARIFTRDLQQRLNKPFFQQQIQSALSLRKKLFAKPYYRLIFSEADGLPGLVIDRFDQALVAQMNTAGIEQKKDALIDAIRTSLPEVNSLLLRNDSQAREYEGLESLITPAFGTPPEEVLLEENEVRFITPLWKGQKTGWFYDHRCNRARLTSYVNDKNVLDVFSYVGAWGVQAAALGANRVTCIESSALACDYISKNAALNAVEDKMTILSEDAFSAMKHLLQDHQTFDVVILDPPAFVKKAKDRKEGLLAYQRLNELAIKLLKKDGVLITCSCSMHVSEEDLLLLLQRVAYRTQQTLQILERGHQGPDHPLHLFLPESNYLKALFVRKISG